MLAIGFTIVLLGLSFLLGRLLLSWMRKWHRASRLALVVAPGILIPITAAGAYFSLYLTYPSTDSRIDTGSQYRLVVYKGLDPVSDATYNFDVEQWRPSINAPSCRIQLIAPSSVHLGDDFTIGVSVSSNLLQKTKVRLNAPPDWKVRSTHECSDGTSTDICIEPGSGESIRRWILRPESAGRSVWAISIAPTLTELCGSPWYAEMQKDHLFLIEPTSGSNKNEILSHDGASGTNKFHDYRKVRATDSDPIHDFGVQVDFNKMQLLGVTQVKQTLGVSAATYSWLALIGAIGASGLGSGWLLKLPALFARPKPKRRAKRPTNAQD